MPRCLGVCFFWGGDFEKDVLLGFCFGWLLILTVGYIIDLIDFDVGVFKGPRRGEDEANRTFLFPCFFHKQYTLLDKTQRIFGFANIISPYVTSCEDGTP